MTGIVPGAVLDYKQKPGGRSIRATVGETYDNQVRITYPSGGGVTGVVVKIDQLTALPQSHAEKANAFHQAAVKAGIAAADAARSAGIELLAAKAELKAEVGHGEWSAWCKANLTFSLRTAQVYMQLAKTQRAALSEAAEKSIREALKQLGREVDEIEEPETEQEKQEREAQEAKWKQEETEWEKGRPEREQREAQQHEILQRENVIKAETREQQYKMIHEYISAGYWALSKKYHPDKDGGSTDIQVRVTAVRDFLQKVFKSKEPCQFCGK